MKDMKIRIKKPAEDSVQGWENSSLMVGNGFLGANVFSDVYKECIAVDEHTLSMPAGEYTELGCPGNECFEKIYIDFQHKDYTDYERVLDLGTAVLTHTYKSEGIKFKRECFASYPERCLVYRIETEKKEALSFVLHPEAPYVREYLFKKGDHEGRTGETRVNGNEIIVEGVSEYFGVIYEAQHRVYTDGQIISGDKSVEVKNASYAYIVTAVGTNFELKENMFDAGDRSYPLKGNPHPHKKIKKIMDNAEKYSYEELKKRHIDDFSAIYNRVSFDIGGKDNNLPCDEMINRYRAGEENPYLEELHFNMGRYLLISSSREGGYPCALQGIWNYYKIAPWTNGYWYNVNIQMNYWPAFTCNMAECFKPYSNFNLKRLNTWSKLADEYIKDFYPENYEEGKNGWIVGTGNGVLYVGDVGGHSGPGTGGLTTQAYFDYYDFTEDKDILRNEIYPVVEGMTRFYLKCLKNYDGEYLVEKSSSPEQHVNGKPYQTVGCAFDQQMVYENNKGFLKVCDLLDYKDVDMELVERVRQQIDKYSPVIIGKSGQVKEYREEEYYGEIGEKNHRHISQLVGLYPGSIINTNTDAWLDSAKITLSLRGLTTGMSWSKAHKALMFSRAQQGEETYNILNDIIKNHTFNNMWGKHYDKGIFQIDGCLGSTAAYGEMLMQSNGGMIEILPAIPSKWEQGSFSGLCARGGFEVSVKWNTKHIDVKIKSLFGKKAVIKCPGIGNSRGNFEYISNDIIFFKTEPMAEYEINDIPVYKKSEPVSALEFNNSTISWQCDKESKYFVYAAEDSDKCYKLIADGIKDKQIKFTQNTRTTIKVVALQENCRPSDGVLKNLA